MWWEKENTMLTRVGFEFDFWWCSNIVKVCTSWFYSKIGSGDKDIFLRFWSQKFFSMCFFCAWSSVSVSLLYFCPRNTFLVLALKLDRNPIKRISPGEIKIRFWRQPSALEDAANNFIINTIVSKILLALTTKLVSSMMFFEQSSFFSWNKNYMV